MGVHINFRPLPVHRRFTPGCNWEVQACEHLVRMPCRALLCGAVNGKFEAFEKRLKSVTDKAGPFAAAFIVGQLFEDGESSAACPESTINAIQRLIQLDILVYFISSEGTMMDVVLESRILIH
jgi:hypothetical protein